MNGHVCEDVSGFDVYFSINSITSIEKLKLLIYNLTSLDGTLDGLGLGLHSTTKCANNILGRFITIIPQIKWQEWNPSQI